MSSVDIWIRSSSHRSNNIRPKLQVILALASMNAVDAYMHKNGAKLGIDDKNGAAAPREHYREVRGIVPRRWRT
ncbi:hypothetical protein VTO73DRAFT_15152 [Trametes versicolor]